MPGGHAGFPPGRSAGGKNTVCASLRASAVNLKLLANSAILSERKLRDDNCIVRFEFEVLAEVFAFGDIFEIYTVNFVFTALMPQEDNFFFWRFH